MSIRNSGVYCKTEKGRFNGLEDAISCKSQPILLPAKNSGINPLLFFADFYVILKKGKFKIYV